MKRRTWLGLILAASLTVHGSTLFFAEPMKWVRQGTLKPYRQKVVVRMMTKPAKPVPDAQQRLVIAKGAQRPAGNLEKPHTAVIARDGQRTPVIARGAKRPAGNLDNASAANPPKTYADLLPGLADLPLAPSGSGGQQPFAPPSQAAATVSDEISGKLDIPLFFRDQGDNANALVKIELKDDSPTGWWFAFVSGDPLLRAVLFEALRDPANAAVVQALFRDIKSNEILISLRQRTVRQPDPHERYAEAVRLEGSKLVIERTLFRAPPLRPESGIALPDEEAKRAVRRDRARLERLTKSPAYISPLRERLP